MAIVCVGVDLAKNVFAIHGVDDVGKTVWVASSERSARRLAQVRWVAGLAVADSKRFHFPDSELGKLSMHERANNGDDHIEMVLQLTVLGCCFCSLRQGGKFSSRHRATALESNATDIALPADLAADDTGEFCSRKARA